MLQDAPLAHLLVARPPQAVPTAGIHAAIALDVLRQGMQRPMRRMVREVLEERLVGLRVLLEHADGRVGDGVRQVEIGGDFRFAIIVLESPRREVMHHAVDMPVEAVEAPLQRCRAVRVAETPGGHPRGPEVSADMPLAGHQRAVAVGFQHFGDRRRILAKIALVGRGAEVRAHVADASAVRIQAGQQRSARGAAAGRVVHGGQQRAVAGDAVDVRRANLSAHDAEVAETEVVGQDDDDVGTTPAAGVGRRGRRHAGHARGRAGREPECHGQLHELPTVESSVEQRPVSRSEVGLFVGHEGLPE